MLIRANTSEEASFAVPSTMEMELIGATEVPVEIQKPVPSSCPVVEVVPPTPSKFEGPTTSIYGKPWQPAPSASKTPLLFNWKQLEKMNPTCAPTSLFKIPQQHPKMTYPSPLKCTPKPRTQRPKSNFRSHFIPPLNPHLSRPFKNKSVESRPHSINIPLKKLPPPLIPNVSRLSKTKFRKPHTPSHSVKPKIPVPLLSIKTNIFLPRSQVLEILRGPAPKAST